MKRPRARTWLLLISVAGIGLASIGLIVLWNAGPIVYVGHAAMPHEPDKREAFVWDHFAHKPEADKFDSYGTEGWKDNFAAFAKVLVIKAEARMLDSGSLRKVLALVLKDSNGEIAYLPVGAYQTTLDAKLVWVIKVKWEYPSFDPHLTHIRMFAFDQKTLERVGYCTCN